VSIYRPAVETSAVSFETVVPTVEEFAERIATSIRGWQWLVATIDGVCVGYAYGSSHRARRAYHWSVEVSAYVHPDHQRQGIARLMYLNLFEQLAGKGFCNAYAGVALPNDASIALHRSLGFVPVGTFRKVGWKFGRWHDVAWFQRVLRDVPPHG
jgi:L-amino acid N-acyltransferase YncA